MRHFFFLFAFVFIAFQATSHTVVGTWRTVDDETSEAKSHVQIYEKGGVVHGKIIKVLRKNAATNCANCPGDLKNKPLVEMVILDKMQPKDGYYQGGNILDPEKGKWYECKIWLKEGDPNTLVVRGNLGPFYRTQYWSRVQ